MKKVRSNSWKKWRFLNEKNIKLTKRGHAFKGYTRTYNVKIRNSFNLEIQFKDTDSTIRNKLIELLTQLKDFKFMASLILVLK